MSNLKLSVRSTLFLGAATAAALTLSGPVRAVETAETIVVTGSRLPSPNLISSSPIATVSAEQIQGVGVQNLDRVINNFPQLVGDIGETSNNGGGGAAFVNLRGLGYNRTLTLVNGRRFVPATLGGSVDLNEIPLQIIDRIDIVTGGASAVYGSDAIAGVVNIVTKQNFEGIQANVEYSRTDKNDGVTRTESVVIGTNTADGKGNVTIYAQNYRQDAIPRSARAISVDDFASATTGWTKITGLNTSTTSDPLALTKLQSIFSGYGATASANTLPLDTSHLGINNGGTLFATYAKVGANKAFNYNRKDNLPTQSDCESLGIECLWNISSQNYLVVPTQRVGVGGEAHYDVSPYLTVFSDLSFQNWQNAHELAANPVTGIRIPVIGPGVAANADLTALLAARGADSNSTFVVSRRLVELGPRIEQDDTSALNVTLGLRGADLPNNWNWETYYSYQRNWGTGNQSGVANLNRMADALGSPQIGTVKYLTGALAVTGTTACASGNAACVPLNLIGTNTITPGAAAYINTTAQWNNALTQQVFAADANGDLFDPFGAGAIQASIGIEYRGQALYQQGDANLTPVDPLDPSSCPVNALNCVTPEDVSQNVREIFTELRIPLVKNEFLIKDLSFEAGYRYSKYSYGVSANTYKLALNWAIEDWVGLRGGFERALRAPTILDTSGPTTQDFPQYNQAADVSDDFCSQNYKGGAPNAATQAYCAHQGVVNPAGFNSTQQQPTSGAFYVSNPKVRPEIANTWNVGATFNGGSIIDNFTASVDYYHIGLMGRINTVQPTVIFDNCAKALSDSNPFCAMIHREPQNGGGEVDTFTVPELNLGSIVTSGLDVNANWGSGLADLGLPDWGVFNVTFFGTWMRNFDVDVAPGVVDVQKLVGSTGNSALNASAANSYPRFRTNTRFVYEVADFNVDLTWRFISSVKDATDNSFTTGAYHYWDLRLAYGVTKWANFYVGVNNLFDKTPPYLPSAFNANTDGSTYDVLGRSFFVGLTLKN